MRHYAIMTGLAALTLAGTASAEDYRYAQSNCDSQRSEQKLIGGLIGGALGAAAGVALGNNLGSGHHSGGYGYNGYNNYGGYGGSHYNTGYGYNGYNRHGGGHHRRRSGNDDTGQIVGALILGGIGAYAGSQIAGDSVKCRTQVYEGIPAPTRQAYGNAWGNGQPAYQQAGARDSEIYGGQYGRRSNTGSAGPETDDRQADKRECEPVIRETKLPDGRVVREQIQACRDGVTYYEPRTAYGDWGVED